MKTGKRRSGSRSLGDTLRGGRVEQDKMLDVPDAGLNDGLTARFVDLVCPLFLCPVLPAGVLASSGSVLTFPHGVLLACPHCSSIDYHARML